MKHIKYSGFTLVELMIVVVIIGILTSVAYPAYKDSLMKTRRTDGQSALLSIMSAQERYYTEKNTYSIDLVEDIKVSEDSAEKYYKITAAACGAGLSSCVLLTATPQGAQASDGNLTYNSIGNKTPIANW